MEDQEQVIQRLKAQAYDLTQEIQGLRQVLSAVAQGLGVQEGASFQELVDAAEKAATVVEEE